MYVLSAVDSSCFFFQAEDGIRDYKVTGVQTCALPISRSLLDHSGDALEGSVFEERFVAQAARSGWASRQWEPAQAAQPRQSSCWPLLTCSGRERPVASSTSRIRLPDGSPALLLCVREADAHSPATPPFAPPAAPQIGRA